MSKDDLPKRATIVKLVELLAKIDQPISDSNLRKHIKKRGLKQAKDKTYSVVAVLNAIKKHREEDNRTKGGELGDQLKALQIKKLEIEIGKLEATIMPMDEHLYEIRELMGHVRATFDHWVSTVSAETKDANLVARAEVLCESAMLKFTDRLKGEE